MVPLICFTCRATKLRAPKKLDLLRNASDCSSWRTAYFRQRTINHTSHAWPCLRTCVSLRCSQPTWKRVWMTTFPKLLKLLRKTPKNLRIRFVAQPLELRNTSAMNKFDLPLRNGFFNGCFATQLWPVRMDFWCWCCSCPARATVMEQLGEPFFRSICIAVTEVNQPDCEARTYADTLDDSAWCSTNMEEYREIVKVDHQQNDQMSFISQQTWHCKQNFGMVGAKGLLWPSH